MGRTIHSRGVSSYTTKKRGNRSSNKLSKRLSKRRVKHSNRRLNKRSNRRLNRKSFKRVSKRMRNNRRSYRRRGGSHPDPKLPLGYEISNRVTEPTEGEEYIYVPKVSGELENENAVVIEYLGKAPGQYGRSDTWKVKYLTDDPEGLYDRGDNNHLSHNDYLFPYVLNQ